MDQSNVNIRSTLFNTKAYEVLLFLNTRKQSYPKEVSSEVDATYSHVVKKLQTYEEQGYARSLKLGRKRNYQLTHKGRELAKKLADVESMIDADSELGESGGSLEEIELAN